MDHHDDFDFDDALDFFDDPPPPLVRALFIAVLVGILIYFLTGCTKAPTHDENMEKMALVDACRIGALIALKEANKIGALNPNGIDSGEFADAVISDCSEMYWGSR